MPVAEKIRFRCPNATCRQKLAATSTHAGRANSCPACGFRFCIPYPNAHLGNGRLKQPNAIQSVAPAGAYNGHSAANPFDFDQPGQPLVQPAPRYTWSNVERGFGLIFKAIIGSVISGIVFPIVMLFVAGLASVVIMGANGNGSQAEAMAMFSLLAGLCTCGAGGIIQLVFGGMIVMGLFHCCAAPEESGVRGFAKGSLACLGIAIVSVVVGFLVNLVAQAFSAGSGRFSVVGLLTYLFMLVAAVLVALLGRLLFVLFLRGVAAYFGNQELAKYWTCFFVTAIAVDIGSVFCIVLMQIFLMVRGTGQTYSRNGPSPPDAAAVLFSFLALAAIVIGVGMAVWYLIMLKLTQRTVRSELANTR